MPDTRRHRGRHPGDAQLFGKPQNLETLRLAAGDLAWLLGRHYAPQAALTLVGNRYQLRLRQRQALARTVAAPAIAQERRCRRVSPEVLTGERLQVDTLNQLITIEAALAGGLLLRGHDGALRDLASVHGTYRSVQETAIALDAVGAWLAPLGLREVEFLIDAAVSNSGRLAHRIRQLAAACDWPWSARLVASPDPILQRTRAVVATSDSSVLDRAGRWLDLAAAVVDRVVPHAWIVDLNVPPPVVT